MTLSSPPLLLRTQNPAMGQTPISCRQLLGLFLLQRRNRLGCANAIAIEETLYAFEAWTIPHA